jgi:hypothetical protein
MLPESWPSEKRGWVGEGEGEETPSPIHPILTVRIQHFLETLTVIYNSMQLSILRMGG